MRAKQGGQPDEQPPLVGAVDADLSPRAEHASALRAGRQAAPGDLHERFAGGPGCPLGPLPRPLHDQLGELAGRRLELSDLGLAEPGSLDAVAVALEQQRAVAHVAVQPDGANRIQRHAGQFARATSVAGHRAIVDRLVIGSHHRQAVLAGQRNVADGEQPALVLGGQLPLDIFRQEVFG